MSVAIGQHRGVGSVAGAGDACEVGGREGGKDGLVLELDEDLRRAAVRKHMFLDVSPMSRPIQ